MRRSAQPVLREAHAIAHEPLRFILTLSIQYDGIKQKMTFVCKDLPWLTYYTKDVNNYLEEEHKWYKQKKSWGHLLQQPY